RPKSDLERRGGTPGASRRTRSAVRQPYLELLEHQLLACGTLGQRATGLSAAGGGLHHVSGKAELLLCSLIGGVHLDLGDRQGANLSVLCQQLYGDLRLGTEVGASVGQV